jgi:hypothetical protein
MHLPRLARAVGLVPLVLASSSSLVACFGTNEDQPGPDAGFALDATTPFDGDVPDATPPSVDAETDAGADAAAPSTDAGADVPVSPADASIDSATDGPNDASMNAPVETGADAALTYPQVVLADSPLSYWRFGESSGTVAVDETGTTNGTYSAAGVTLGAPGAIAGDSNTAATFDGASGYVDMGAAFAFGGVSPMTYEAWFKPNPADTAARRFLSKETINSGGRQGFLMAYDLGGPLPDGGAPNTLLSWERWLNSGVDAVIAIVTPGVYQHVVVTYDGSTMTMYLNGQTVGSTASTRSIAALTDPFRVATYSDGLTAADCFGGTIDEVAIYDHALSAARVLLHYDVGTGM